MISGRVLSCHSTWRRVTLLLWPCCCDVSRSVVFSDGGGEVTSGLCRCARRPAGGSPGSARHSTSGTCTRTWWSGWPGTCRSPGRSTSPRSRPLLGTSGCRPALRSPSTLQGERERERGLLSTAGLSVLSFTAAFCRNIFLYFQWLQLIIANTWGSCGSEGRAVVLWGWQFDPSLQLRPYNIIENPNSFHNEQTLWCVREESPSLTGRNLEQNQTQCGRPSASSSAAWTSAWTWSRSACWGVHEAQDALIAAFSSAVLSGHFLLIITLWVSSGELVNRTQKRLSAGFREPHASTSFMEILISQCQTWWDACDQLGQPTGAVLL